MLGRHAIKHWSSTQTSVALSSGEAEFAGVIRGSGQGLGYQALLRDFGVEAHLRVWTDSSAAIGICSRQGLGKLRHLDTHTLWIQQAVRTGRVDLRKVAGEVNPADLFTKHGLSQLRLEELVALHGCKYLGGRAESVPLTRTGVSSKTTMASAGKTLGAVAGDGENPLGTSSVDVSGTLHGGAAVAQAHNDLGSGSPVMPHLDHDSQSLDAAYPSIVTPDDDWQEDVVDDSQDGILKAGERIASEIREAMQTGGRRRRGHGDMVGLVGESSVGNTTHAGRVGRSNLESQQRDARLVKHVPTRTSTSGGHGGMGRGGLGGKTGTEQTKTGSFPAANTFRRRSVRTYCCPGRELPTTTTPTSTSSARTSTRTFGAVSTSSTSSTTILGADLVTTAADAESEVAVTAPSELLADFACFLYDLSAHVCKLTYRDIQLP